MKEIFAIMLYQLGSQSEQDKEFQNFLSEMSKIYFTIDWITVYILQYVLILIPYNWMGKVMNIYSEFLSN